MAHNGLGETVTHVSWAGADHHQGLVYSPA